MTAVLLPKVSLIISNFNGKDMLRECLDSLMKLDYPNYEIIVVDASSTDGTPDMVKNEFPEVILVAEKRKLGLGEAINDGIAVSTGEIIGYDLNNDEVFSRNWLSSIVDELTSTDDKKVVGGMRLRYDNPDVIDSVGEKIDFAGTVTHVDVGKRISEVSLKTRELDYVGCPVFKTSLIEKMSFVVGSRRVFDEKYHFFYEDSDFCAMAKSLGYKIMTKYSAISYHKGSSTVKTESAKQYYYLERNRLRFIIKHFSTDKLLVAIPWWFFYRIFYDTLLDFPFTQVFLLHLGIQKKPHESRALSRINAVYWNFVNMKDHFKERAIAQEIVRHAQQDRAE